MEQRMNTTLNLKQRNLKLALASTFVLGVTMSSHSFAEEGTATATATVITPIAIAKAQDLVFGKFAPGAGGSVTVSTSGARTATGAILSTIGSTPTAAKFNVTGDTGATYAITYTGTSATLSNTDPTPATMALAYFSDLTAGDATTGTASTGTLTSGAQSIYVGGTLTVGSTQASGTYSGNVKVQVEYN
jgi:hypothetical protein